VIRASIRRAAAPVRPGVGVSAAFRLLVRLDLLIHPLILTINPDPDWPHQKKSQNSGTREPRAIAVAIHVKKSKARSHETDPGQANVLVT
jgi:hypothetical protein